MSKSVLIICHPLRGKTAREQFLKVVERVVARQPENDVRGVFLWEEDVNSTVKDMVEGGASSIYMLPYFLHNGSHVIEELNSFIESLRLVYPRVDFSLGQTLGSDMLVEDAICSTISDVCAAPEKLPTLGDAIESRSHDIIERRLECSEWTGVQKAVLKRVIHSTADFSFINTMDFHPHALAVGLQALRDGAPVICDVNMLKSGITRLDNEIICIINEERTRELALQQECTRAAASMRILKDRLDGAVVAVGNAPTAIWELLRLGVKPAMVVGVPVGFVGARESKQALIASPLLHVSNRSERGGSPVAAAVLNALAVLLAHEKSKGNS